MDVKQWRLGLLDFEEEYGYCFPTLQQHSDHKPDIIERRHCDYDFQHEHLRAERAVNEQIEILKKEQIAIVHAGIFKHGANKSYQRKSVDFSQKMLGDGVVVDAQNFNEIEESPETLPNYLFFNLLFLVEKIMKIYPNLCDEVKTFGGYETLPYYWKFIFRKVVSIQQSLQGRVETWKKKNLDSKSSSHLAQKFVNILKNALQHLEKGESEKIESDVNLMNSFTEFLRKDKRHPHFKGDGSEIVENEGQTKQIFASSSSSASTPSTTNPPSTSNNNNTQNKIQKAKHQGLDEQTMSNLITSQLSQKFNTKMATVQQVTLMLRAHGPPNSDGFPQNSIAYKTQKDKFESLNPKKTDSGNTIIPPIQHLHSLNLQKLKDSEEKQALWEKRLNDNQLSSGLCTYGLAEICGEDDSEIEDVADEFSDAESDVDVCRTYPAQIDALCAQEEKFLVEANGGNYHGDGSELNAVSERYQNNFSREQIEQKIEKIKEVVAGEDLIFTIFVKSKEGSAFYDVLSSNTLSELAKRIFCEEDHLSENVNRKNPDVHNAFFFIDGVLYADKRLPPGTDFFFQFIQIIKNVF